MEEEDALGHGEEDDGGGEGGEEGAEEEEDRQKKKPHRTHPTKLQREALDKLRLKLLPSTNHNQNVPTNREGSNLFLVQVQSNNVEITNETKLRKNEMRSK